jgi:hypothetical protein
MNQIPATFHKPRQSRPPWFDSPKNIRWGAKIMKLPIMQLSPFSDYFFLLRRKYLSQHPIFEHTEPICFLSMETKIHTHIELRENYVPK